MKPIRIFRHEDWIQHGYDIEPSSPSVQPIEQIRERLVQRCFTMHSQFTDRLYDAWLARAMKRTPRAFQG